MPRKKWINRNDPNTQTYQLLYRSQDDPLLHDNADERALFPIANKTQQGQSAAASSSQYDASITHKGLQLSDLEDAHAVDLESMRENEGEAAQYGIYYDDTKYDYMQHLKEI